MAARKEIPARGPGMTGGEPRSSASRRTKVMIVGAGDEVLMEIGPALGNQYHSYSVDTGGEIATVSTGTWIGVYDASNHAAGRSAFAQLESQYPQHPWIVICADEDRPHWRDSLSRGGVCAVIARSELGVSRFAEALDKAVQRLRNPHSAAPARPTSNRLMELRWWMAGAGLVAVAAGAMVWLSHPHTRNPGLTAVGPQRQGLPMNPGRPAVAAPAGVASGATPASQGFEDLLSQARIAFRDPALQLPKADGPLQGTSALELYGAVLLQQPTNKEALDGVRRLHEVARLRIQNALAAGNSDMAARLLAILPHGDFAPEELRTLAASVAAAQSRQLAAQARSALAAGNLPVARQRIDKLLALQGEGAPIPELRRALAARQVDLELATDAEQVRAAITAGALLEPVNDNARTRFLRLRDLNRTSPQTVAAQHDLLLALLRRTQAEIARQDLDGAQQTLAIAQDFGSKSELAETRTNLDSALGAKRTADAAAAKAARASAPNAEKVVTASILSPRPTRALQVDFPPAALAENIKGYAIIEFMLNPNGSASQATVVESAPPRTFDSAALAAIRRATFSTQSLADPKRPQRARFRINFTVGDSAGHSLDVSRAAAAAGAATSSAVRDPLQILSPKPTQPLRVNYPQVALALNRTGYVVVEFMLNPDGTPGSPKIIESVPAKLFDYEALLAVERARFVTTDLANPTRAQRARVKITFMADGPAG